MYNFLFSFFNLNSFNNTKKFNVLVYVIFLYIPKVGHFDYLVQMCNALYSYSTLYNS